MVEIIWEYEVNEEARGFFELAFGPGGVVSRLFAGASGFHGATLLRDIGYSGRYLSIEVWENLEKREQVLRKRESEYEKLEADFASWSESRREVGTFRMLAEAAVRPQIKPRRRRPGRRGRGIT